MSGYRTWTPGEILTASNVQNYLQDQTVMVFASSTARGTALLSPDEGMLTWLQDDNKYQYWNGSSWVDLYDPISNGTAGQALVANGTAVATFADVNAKFLETTITNKTASHTAIADDVNTVLNFDSAGTSILTIPDIFPSNGDRIDVIRNGAGVVAIAAGTGVTSWAGVGTAGTATVFNVDVQYAAATVIKTGSSAYRVIGRISA